MMRKSIFAAVALSALLIFSGCASKTATDAINSPSTATATNEASALSSTSVLSEQVSAPSSATLSTLDGRALETVYFDYDAFTIKPGARQALERNAAWLNAKPSIRVTIEGHCDERGSDEYNLALGERRAIAVKYYLVNLGIAAERLITISYGEERPAVDGQGETAWSKNRRVEFK
jgi:peptidoglycan-associated lipoprotein